MLHYRIRIFFAFIIVLIITSKSVGQNSPSSLVYHNSNYLYNQSYSYSQIIAATSSSPIVIGLPPQLTIPHSNIANANLTIKLDMGQNYLYGTGTGGATAANFNYVVSFNIAAYNANTLVTGVFNTTPYQLIIQNTQPEAVFNLDFSSFAESTSGTDFSFTSINISNVQISTPPNITLNTTLISKMRFEVSYNIAYGLDVITGIANPAITITSQPPMVQGKQLTFNWSNNGYEFPDYEFQLLRLFNNYSTTATSETNITTTIDWSKALKIETESSATSLTLTMSEGQGFYVWRVRPIGNFYPGGIANALNYSDATWSYSPPNSQINYITLQSNGTTVTVGGGYTVTSNPNPFFFFQDTDDAINWIYSRTFTEGNRISEEISYANSLQQEKQSQSYLPSKDTTLISQTIPDKTGRPSLKTLPAPVAGGINGYQSTLVQTNMSSILGLHLYTSDDYDKDINYKNPTQVDENVTNYKYYSNNNPDLRIPDAQGYPFSRTLYYNDGTERVMEQSGVGQANILGDGTVANGGQGKTVKTYYGSASETELISLFGDEAPDNESVMKTITVDENNTASVTYTSKEGHVIATALSFQDNDNLNVFAPLANEPAASSVTNVSDKVTQNIQIDSSFVSTKRVVLLQASPLTLSYSVGCQTLTNACGSPTLNCNYQVQILIHCVENPANSILNLPIQSVSCSTAVTWSDSRLLSLAAGTYVIEKILTTTGGGVSTSTVTSTSENQIMPIVSLIKVWLASVNCPAALTYFYNTQLPGLAASLNNSLSNPETLTAFISNNGIAPTFVYTGQRMFITNGPNGNPSEVTLESPCCTLNVPVTYTPPFTCPSSFTQVDVNKNGTFDVNYDYFNSPQNTEYFPDLEGYAVSFLNLVGCTMTPATFYQQYMTGWDNPGDFNMMVYYMLTDEYSCSNTGAAGSAGNPAPNGGSVPVTDECGNTTTSPGIACDGNGNCNQYQCSNIANCWTKQILALQTFLCSSDFSFNNPMNPADSADNDSNGNQSVLNDQFDDNFSGAPISKRKKKKLAKKVSQIMRDLSDPTTSGASQLTYSQHIVQDFLQCTGQQFAKILLPEDPCPFPTDADPNGGITTSGATTDNTYSLNYASTAATYLAPLLYTSPCNSCNNATGCKAMPYTPGRNNFTDPNKLFPPTPMGGPTPANQKPLSQLFYGIKDPIYAFKYFTYDRGRPDLEASSCFSDPNDCYATTSPGGPIVVVTDNSTGTPLLKPVKVPCCAIQTNNTYSLTGTPYPFTTNNLCGPPVIPTPAINLNYDSDNNGINDQKILVNDFCGLGQIVCPYTYEYWNCGQRYTFYTILLNSLTLPPGEVNSPSTTIALTCEDFTTPNPPNPTGDLTDGGWNPDELANWVAWNNIPTGQLGTTAYPYPSIVQYEMMQMQQNCLSTCSQRQEQFRSQLLQVLNQKCYIIDGCKQNVDDNVILTSDIDAIVAQMFSACTTQCPITTYYCPGPEFCRDINTSLTITGPTDSDINIQYGVSTLNDPNCPQGNCAAYAPYTTTPSPLTFCEQTQWNMAMSWDFDIDIPSKCTTNYGEQDFTCIGTGSICTTVPPQPPGGTPLSSGTLTNSNLNAPPTYSTAIPINVSAP